MKTLKISAISTALLLSGGLLSSLAFAEGAINCLLQCTKHDV